MGTRPQPEAPCLECTDWPPILRSARAAVILEPPADSLVHALKYGGWRELGEFMGRTMASAAPTTQGNLAVIPMPTTPRRRRERGYNQAQVLAEAVAKTLRVPLLEALVRPKGGTQVGLAPNQRKGNVQDAFRLLPNFRSRIRGLEVILIDDVLTTGATAVSAASTLENHGVDTVHLVTFARALPAGVERRAHPPG